MFRFVLIAQVLVTVLSTPVNKNELALAEECKPDECKLPNCRCPSTVIPNNLPINEVPQLVMFTFDDAVSVLNFHYYQQAFTGKKNPDGCSVGATFFVSHESNNYSMVHELHAQGHEIALHSITHKPDTDYWKNLSVEGHIKEFEGLQKMLMEFAGIPKKDMFGMRVPFLQLSGNNSFELIKKINLTYDSSWPTQTYMKPPLWPYTLDYRSIQDCPIGPCPTVSLPGVWVMPMVDWVDEKGYVCPMVDSCVYIPNNVDDLLKFFIKNFERHYTTNRAPFGFYVHAAWFNRNIEVYFGAYKKFVDHLLTLKDVYLVNIERARQWVQNPISLKSNSTLWPSCRKTYKPTCKSTYCRYPGEPEQNLAICKSDCPNKYPWLDNPLGN